MTGPRFPPNLGATDITRPSGIIIPSVDARAARKDEWLERRGDILMKMGRVGEARAAYQAALDAIEKLPPERRRTRATIAMAQRLRAALNQS